LKEFQMSDLAFVAVAYGVVWLVLFVYVFSLVQREQELRRDLRLITSVLRERDVLPPDLALENGSTPDGQPLEVAGSASAR
jgi:CcmD family protein